MALPKIAFLIFCSFLIASGAAAQCAEERLTSADAAYQKNDFAAALKEYEAAIAGGLDDSSTHYNAACAAARSGQNGRALAHLDAALKAGFDDCRQLQADADLTALHGEKEWGALAPRCEATRQLLARFWDGDTWKVPFATNLSDADKIAGLSRVWSEAKFNFANFSIFPDLDWDRAYREAIPKVLATRNTAEYYVALSEFMALLHDGHSSIHPPREVSAQLQSAPALTTAVAGGRVYIRSVWDPALEKNGIRPLLELVSIDGTPVRPYGDKLRTRIAASTPQDLEIQTFEHQLLEGPAETSLALGLVDEKGTKITADVPRLSPVDRAKLRPQRPLVTIAQLPDGLVHVTLSTFNDSKVVPEFEKHLDEIRASKGLILDLRDNGGGNSANGDRILGMITSSTFPSQRWWTREYRPAYRAWGMSERTYQRTERLRGNGERAFSGPVVLLVSGRTYSAAEDFTAAFRGAARGPIVGSRSGGSTGQPLRFALPGGGSGQICTKRNTLADGTEYVGVGIVPDVEVATTLEDIRAGRDPVRDAAVRILESR